MSFFDIFGKNAIFPTESSVLINTLYGENGNNLIGTYEPAANVTPSVLGFSTGVIYTHGHDGQIKEGVNVKIKIIEIPPNNGRAFDESIRTLKSDENGLIEFTNLLINAKYKIWMGSLSDDFLEFTVPDQSSFLITSFIGDSQ